MVQDTFGVKVSEAQTAVKQQESGLYETVKAALEDN
jgi:hypothetical protein